MNPHPKPSGHRVCSRRHTELQTHTGQGQSGRAVIQKDTASAGLWVLHQGSYILNQVITIHSNLSGSPLALEPYAPREAEKLGLCPHTRSSELLHKPPRCRTPLQTAPPSLTAPLPPGPTETQQRTQQRAADTHATLQRDPREHPACVAWTQITDLVATPRGGPCTGEERAGVAGPKPSRVAPLACHPGPPAPQSKGHLLQQRKRV